MKRRFPNVNVYAPKKAWVDSNFVIDWLKDYKKESGAGEKLLGLDHLGFQCSPEFKELVSFTHQKTALMPALLMQAHEDLSKTTGGLCSTNIRKTAQISGTSHVFYQLQTDGCCLCNGSVNAGRK
jgi:hypothetical protein